MHLLVELAKSAIENYVTSGTEITVPLHFLNDLLNKKAGVFVKIEKDKELRGCIGTYLPCHKNIAEETIHNAILAAAEDYRFGPIKKDELPHLSFTVYILGEPELVRDQKELNPKKYGVIVESSDKKRVGLLLPDLKGVDTISEQISIACAKAEIDPSEHIIIYKFTAEKYQ